MIVWVRIRARARKRLRVLYRGCHHLVVTALPQLYRAIEGEAGWEWGVRWGTWCFEVEPLPTDRHTWKPAEHLTALPVTALLHNQPVTPTALPLCLLRHYAVPS